MDGTNGFSLQIVSQKFIYFGRFLLSTRKERAGEDVVYVRTHSYTFVVCDLD